MTKRINLIGWRDKQRENNRRRLLFIIVAVSLSLCISQIGVGRYLHKHWVSQQAKVNKLEQQIEAVEQRLLALKSAKHTQSSLLAQIEQLESLQKTSCNVTAFSRLLPTLIPEGVYIDHIRLVESEIEIVGFSETTSSITFMLKTLNREPTILGIELHSIIHGHQRFGRDFQQFSLSFQYDHLLKNAKVNRQENRLDG